QWMYPVRDVGAALPEAFSTLVEVETPLTFSPDEVLQNRKAWVAEWREALSK
ncbi:MAG: thiamine ABC transporter substrate-binding protein, partial [Rhizobiales bacterium]|nr:thiamine ABC transporter substrate-binding protein [Hyphomicrobiales bacterium]